MLIDAARLLLFPAMMAFAASTDLFTMTISNRVSLILAAGFLVLAGARRYAGGGDRQSYRRRASSCSRSCFVFFHRGWIGGGDAKLAAATALWLGWGHLYEYLLYASLMGGVLTLRILEFRKRTLPPALARQPWVVRLHEPAGGVPYGIALAAAALLVYPSTVWMRAAG